MVRKVSPPRSAGSEFKSVSNDRTRAAALFGERKSHENGIVVAPFLRQRIVADRMDSLRV